MELGRFLEWNPSPDRSDPSRRPWKENKSALLLSDSVLDDCVYQQPSECVFRRGVRGHREKVISDGQDTPRVLLFTNKLFLSDT